MFEIGEEDNLGSRNSQPLGVLIPLAVNEGGDEILSEVPPLPPVNVGQAMAESWTRCSSYITRIPFPLPLPPLSPSPISIYDAVPPLKPRPGYLVLQLFWAPFLPMEERPPRPHPSPSAI